MDLQAKRCMECGTVYFGDEVNAMFATVTVGLDRRVYPKTTCNPCRLTKRTQVKSQNRFVAKARDTIRRHTVRLSQWVSSTGDLADRFGWEVKRVAHDMEHAWKNGCPDCGNLFSTMVHGLGDLSVDIIDPANPPFWGINTRIMCIIPLIYTIFVVFILLRFGLKHRTFSQHATIFVHFHHFRNNR